MSGSHRVFWHDGTLRHTASASVSGEALKGRSRCDVVVVGAGFSGVWTALALKERAPDVSITVLEAGSVPSGAPGLSGGLVDPSLSHTIANAERRWPEEAATIVSLGLRNLADIEETIRRERIECGFRRAGEFDVATADWQTEELERVAESYQRHSLPFRLVDRQAMGEAIFSPAYSSGLFRPEVALVDPAALVVGLVGVASRQGVRVFESSRARGISQGSVSGRRVLTVSTEDGVVSAEHVVVAVNADTADVLPASGRRYAPVATRVAVTERLPDSFWKDVGWKGRWGVATASNMFFYYRPTDDGRILIGGGDGYLASGGRLRDLCTSEIEGHLVSTFPGISDVGFEYRWQGLTEVTSDTSFMVERAGGVVAIFGYTGLGIAASRFAASLAADHILSPGSDIFKMDFVSRRPLGFPRGLARRAGVAAVRRALRAADVNGGRRGVLLRALGRVGIDFEV